MWAGGTVVHMPGERTEMFWFPEDCLVTLRASTRDRSQPEIAAIGYEGVLGWAALLGCESEVHEAVVEGRGGTITAMPRAALLSAFEHSDSVKLALLGFVHAMTTQMAGTISSAVGHTLEHRLARWLLLRHDRAIGDQVFVRHDTIAEALGARRASITDCLHVLEGNRLVRARRGQIVVRDRSGLERCAGDAYGLDDAGRYKLVAPKPSHVEFMPHRPKLAAAELMLY